MLETVSSFHTVAVVNETLFQDLPNVSHVTFGSDGLQKILMQCPGSVCFTETLHLAQNMYALVVDQLWYKSSVVKCSQDVVKSCLTGFKSVNDSEWICITCDSNLKKGKLPSCSKANKMEFPDKPEVLNLTSLEE